MEAVEAWKKVVLGNYANFEGRANRAEFWWFVLANLVISIGLAILARIAGLFVLIQVAYALAVLIPGLAVTIRRLQDTGRPWPWVLLVFIPLVGGIILLVLLAGEGNVGNNEFGPPPPPGVSYEPA